MRHFCAGSLDTIILGSYTVDLAFCYTHFLTGRVGFNFTLKNNIVIIRTIMAYSMYKRMFLVHIDMKQNNFFF